MASYDNYPVLKAIVGLTGKTSDGKPSVISLKAIAAQTGLKQPAIKAILARNEHALVRNDAGSLVGTKIVSAASEKGLAIMVRKLGHFFFKGEKVGYVNINLSSFYLETERLREELQAKHGVLVCENFRDLSDDVVRAVWNEGVA